jgi:hypothetical protein
MAASILEIVSVGTNQDQQQLNRWHFVNAAGSSDVTGVMEAFVADVLAPYRAVASGSTYWTELLWRIITDPLSPQNIYPITPPLQGTNPGAPAPSFNCSTIRWALGATVILTAEVPQRRVRRGSKHLGGITDDQFGGNLLTPASKLLASAVAEGYLGMSVGGFEPCVCGFPKRAPHVPGTPTQPTDPPNKYCPIVGFTVNATVGSEVSRKAGHGD